ncbi:hypothetical protein IFM89_023707, partial [Coptis chinensis]
MRGWVSIDFATLMTRLKKLIREKGHWERRIIDLGGQNYIRHSARKTDLDGNIVDVPNPSGRGPGYRYFGAAKKLPGVRELFEKPPELRKRRSREKGHWERRIIYLGGQNYTRHSTRKTDLDGNIVDVPNPSGRGPGYRYFGAAKKLLGVRELFEKPPELRKRRS